MKLNKLAAAFVSAAMALSVSAVSAFAESTTIQLDSDYAGNWGAGAYIPKEDLEAVGGDVKITLDVETVEPGNEDQFLVTPMDYSTPAWSRITNQCTTESGIAKEDQFIVLVEGEKSVEFVVPADVIAGLTDKDGECGIGFQVCNVIVKSATLEPGSPENEFRIIDDDNVIPYCFGEYQMPDAEETADEEAAPASDEAPVTDAASDDTFPATGNTSAAVITSVAALACLTAVMTRKKK